MSASSPVHCTTYSHDIAPSESTTATEPDANHTAALLDELRQTARALRVTAANIEAIARTIGATIGDLPLDMLRIHTCAQCGHRWAPARAQPRYCPSCRTTAWDRPLVQLG